MSQNNPIWILIRSLLITLGVALVMGGGAGIITGSLITGIVWFIMTIVAQYAINSIVMTFAARKNKEAEFLATQVLREAAERQLPIDLNCAYCNTLNRVGISFVSENSFNCVKCQQPNKVYIQFSTVRVTTPLSPKESTTNYVDMDSEPGVSQSTINQPIKMNEK